MVVVVVVVVVGRFRGPFSRGGSWWGSGPAKPARGPLFGGGRAGPVIGEVYDKENGKKDPR